MAINLLENAHSGCSALVGLLKLELLRLFYYFNKDLGVVPGKHGRWPPQYVGLAGDLHF